jgi:hypothetical protein
MSLDKPQQNKMMTAAPDKKEYHFAASAEYCAAVVFARTIEEAEALYHKVKRPLRPAPAAPTEQSPTDAEPAPSEAGVQ